MTTWLDDLRDGLSAEQEHAELHAEWTALCVRCAYLTACSLDIAMQHGGGSPRGWISIGEAEVFEAYGLAQIENRAWVRHNTSRFTNPHVMRPKDWRIAPAEWLDDDPLVARDREQGEFIRWYDERADHIKHALEAQLGAFSFIEAYRHYARLAPPFVQERYLPSSIPSMLHVAREPFYAVQRVMPGIVRKHARPEEWSFANIVIPKFVNEDIIEAARNLHGHASVLLSDDPDERFTYVWRITPNWFGGGRPERRVEMDFEMPYFRMLAERVLPSCTWSTDERHVQEFGSAGTGSPRRSVEGGE